MGARFLLSLHLAIALATLKPATKEQGTKRTRPSQYKEVGIMLDELRALQTEALEALEAATDMDALDQWRVTYLGRSGELTTLLRSIGRLPPEQRPHAGRTGNEVRAVLEGAYAEKAEALERTVREAALEAERVDVTLPGRPVQIGRLHLTTQVLRQIYDIFAQMGFQVYDAPEVETDELNFGLLNMPPYHPARDLWDTFWVDDEAPSRGSARGVLLRTHTSPGQIRVMRERCPEPIRVILPGKVYRYEQVTARAEHQFYQVEGLAVGRHITMADLKGTMLNFARMFYGPDREVRLRGSYFPFTEPSVEFDGRCVLCHGEGCRVCKHSGWLELAGAGMVHPVVLENGGYDPAIYSGFAFGIGVERPALLKYDIDDIRYFYGNDLRFLRQF
jgi:phenylalanyl-tRNA synthetase alpha chain